LEINQESAQAAALPGIVKLNLQTGFSLIEVTIALSVAAFCLLAILGLLQTGITSQRATVEQTAATGIVSMLFADLTAEGTNDSPRFQIKRGAATAAPQTLYFDDGGKPTGPINSPPSLNARYRATLEIRPPASPTNKAATPVRLLVTWPAAADPLPAQWPVKHSGAVETWTALDLN
jgi:uncharacterized protein (TIGR02598 family)